MASHVFLQYTHVCGTTRQNYSRPLLIVRTKPAKPDLLKGGLILATVALRLAAVALWLHWWSPVMATVALSPAVALGLVP